MLSQNSKLASYSKSIHVIGMEQRVLMESLIACSYHKLNHFNVICIGETIINLDNCFDSLGCL